uniref:Putative transposase n=1 Tax=Xenopsylla cheopis TaxID=163159 RepID=A0A6M2DL09_XENCH
MWGFVPTNHDLRTQLILLYHLNKNASEAHRILVEAYGELALGRTQCNEWFNKFKSGNFNVRNEERGRPPKKFADAELQALLDEDDSQTQEMMAEQLNVTQKTISLRLKSMGLTLKVGRWVPHTLTERQQENRKITCEMLLKRFKKKSFLHRIITGSKKWVYFKPKTMAKKDCFDHKALLCVFWDHLGMIWYELLKPSEAYDGPRYQQQLADLKNAMVQKRSEYQSGQHKVIFLDDDAPPHRIIATQDIVESYDWEPMTHAVFSPDLAPSDYHLFASIGNALSEQHLNSYENVKKWLDDWFVAKNSQFFCHGIHELPKRWEKCVASNGNYFED